MNTNYVEGTIAINGFDHFINYSGGTHLLQAGEEFEVQAADGSWTAGRFGFYQVVSGHLVGALFVSNGGKLELSENILVAIYLANYSAIQAECQTIKNHGD